jgi:hypothetical protein
MGRGSLISDHALLRFMERIVDVPINDFEALMYARLDVAKDMGDGWLIGPEGEHYLTGHRGSIITVMRSGMGAAARSQPIKHRRLAR